MACWGSRLFLPQPFTLLCYLVCARKSRRSSLNHVLGFLFLPTTLEALPLDRLRPRISLSTSSFDPRLPLLLVYHYDPLGPPRCGVSILATTKLAGFRLLLSLSLPSQGPKIWVCGGDKKPP
ncbi:hypothetical protein D6C93_08790 [Aureobasidium pullulans]|nr:hypothetical protein D6C93_08790 [Aureobasidium pullulans]